LAIAQHHGLPTRLLDWTINPLIALFFAATSPLAVDGAVYGLLSNDWVDGEREKMLDPFKIENVHIYMPRSVSTRIASQSGVFSIQPDPTTPLQEQGMVCIRIDNQAKSPIRNSLLRYGIHAKSVFADMDGLAEYIQQITFERGVAAESKSDN
jgi:hypothetical protein